MHVLLFLIVGTMCDELIELKRQSGQPFGVGFEDVAMPPYCRVNDIVEGGAAQQNGRIRVGDLLLGINGKNLQHVTTAKLKDVMVKYRNENTLIIEIRHTTLPAPDHLSLDTPVINIDRQSPENVSKDGSSPNRSPLAARRIRKMGGTLTDIKEGKSVDTPGYLLVGNRNEHRNSLTPQTTRKIREIEKLKICKSTSLDLANLPQWRKTAGQSVGLEYLINGSEMVDQLHNHELKVSE